MDSLKFRPIKVWETFVLPWVWEEVLDSHKCLIIAHAPLWILIGIFIEHFLKLPIILDILHPRYNFSKMTKGNSLYAYENWKNKVERKARAYTQKYISLEVPQYVTKVEKEAH